MLHAFSIFNILFKKENLKDICSWFRQRWRLRGWGGLVVVTTWDWLRWIKIRHHQIDCSNDFRTCTCIKLISPSKGNSALIFSSFFILECIQPCREYIECACVWCWGDRWECVCVFGGGGRGRVGRKLTRTSEKTLDWNSYCVLEDFRELCLIITMHVFLKSGN